jgi:hypothetical protein
VAAAVVDVAVFAIGSAAGADWVTSAPYPVSWIIVVIFSVVPLVAAAWVAKLIVRRRPGFQRPAAWAGLAFAVVTIAGSLQAPQILTGVSLGLMHVVAGAAWFFVAWPGRTRS